jgi:SAM-dependent methyltransferase
VTLNDPAAVAREYATEAGLEARRAAYRHATGPNAPELAFEALAEVRPRRVVEVGCGPGELAARTGRELGAVVVAFDSSARMVELARGRGVDARLGDVQALPLADDSFDCAVAAWMLYHVHDVDLALAELARVLRPGGRLVAVTNRLGHLRELRELLGLPPRTSTPFSGENGEELLRRHFGRIELREAAGTIRFPDRDAVVAFVRASSSLFGGRTTVPAFEGPLVVQRSPVIFVAET